MAKTFLKAGKVVVVLNGRFAGKKAVIVKSFDGTKTRKYGHCLVAGVEKCPRKVTKRMNNKTILRRTRVKPFVKVLNWNHVMPTRFVIAFSQFHHKSSTQATNHTLFGKQLLV